jgi:hypothetical protein
MDSEDNGIDALISDIEEGLQDDEDELQGLLGVQAISSEELEASHQRTVSGAEEEKDSSSDNESSQEPNSFDEEAADLDRENPYNAYNEEEEEQEDHNATMANQPVVIDVAGLKLTIRATPTTADATARALFPMEDRHSYPADKLASLFEAIGKAQKNKFGLLTLALEDQDKGGGHVRSPDAARVHQKAFHPIWCIQRIHHHPLRQRGLAERNRLQEHPRQPFGGNNGTSCKVKCMVRDDGRWTTWSRLSPELDTLGNVPFEQHGGRIEALLY